MGNTISKIQFSENAIIYKISCKDELIKDCYIGSSFNFDHRYKQHKSDCNNENSKDHNLKIYQFIRNNGGWDNFKFEILLSFDCENTKQKVLKEQYFIDVYKASLNSCKAIRTEEEKKDYDKEYYENNKAKLLEQNKKYYENNKEKNKDKIKKYQENHKAKLTEKFNCDCGGKYQFQHKSRHNKSKRHQKFLESKENL
jgi:hypothetical protein